MIKQDIEYLIQKNKVKEIKKIVDNSHNNFDELIFGYASQIGRIDIVKLMLNNTQIDPANNDNLPIQFAAVNGYFDLAKLLLKDKRVNPTTQNNLAIRDAFQNRFYNIVELLWKDKRVRKSLQKDNPYLFHNLLEAETKNKINNF